MDPDFDLEQHRATADEWYVFDGEDDKPPYWLARHGLTVTSSLAGREIVVTECDDLDEARGAFADGTCDDSYDADGILAPGAPIPGDLITVHYPREETFTIASVDSQPHPDGWTEHAVSGGRHPQTLTLGQYTIHRRTA